MAGQAYQGKEFFQDFCNKVQSSRLTDLEDVFHNLEMLLTKELPVAALREITHGLLLTLPRYNDKKSRYLVKQSMRKILEQQSTLGLQALVNLLHKTTVFCQIKNITKSSAKLLLTALDWSSIIGTYCIKNNASDELLKSVIESQAQLTFSAVEPRCKKITKSVTRKLSSLWILGPDSVKRCAQIMNSCEQSLPLLILWGFLYDYLGKKKEHDLSNTYKKNILENFTKIVLGSKTPVPIHLVQQSFFLRTVNHDDFQHLLLPAMLKAMLRNPENVLETVSQILAIVVIDLSKYSTELGKGLSVYLYSKVDVCRDEASKALKNFAQQCSDPEAIGELVNHLFCVLNGSEGKLTVYTQKVGVLNGIGNLSYLAVRSSSSLQTLSESVANQFINFLKQETHEGTIVHALNMLSLWCPKFTTSVPESLIKWFKEGITLKASTPAVRVAYLECVLTSFQGNTLLQGLQVSDMATKALERALSQPTQPGVVSEGLVASCFLLKLYISDSQAENKLKSQLNTILDIQKMPFLQEKFLHSATASALCYIPVLVERLVLNHDIAIADRMCLINRAMLFCLTHPSYLLRQKSQSCVCKLVSVLGGSQFAIQLLQELTQYISKVKLVSEGNQEDKENKDHGGSTSVRVALVKDCLLTICSGKNMDQPDAHLLGQETLLPSHLPMLYEMEPTLWPSLLKKLKLNPTSFVEEHKLKFQGMVLSEEFSDMAMNALSTLISLAPSVFLPVVVDQLSTLLRDNKLFQVTVEEHNIFLTPEGELYNKSIIENLKDDSANIKNIKRESKLYSYKDQMEELELRKELEAKKKAKSQAKEPEMTKKQIEAMKAELKKESEIRGKIVKLDMQLKRATQLIAAAINGDKLALSSHISKLISALLPLIHSPLCAQVVCKAYLDLRTCVMKPEDAVWGLSVAHLVLRVLKPECQLDPAWLEENLEECINRHLERFQKKVCLDPEMENFETEEPKDQQCLPAPTFVYIFPLIHSLLTNPETKETVFSTCLELISAHVSVESVSNTDSQQYVELPFKQMLETLVNSIERKSGKTELLACKALLDVCKRISQEKATMREIGVLLIAFQSSKDSVREVGLRALSVLQSQLPQIDVDSENGLLIMRRIWVARFDKKNENVALADQLWKDAGLQFNPLLAHLLLSDVVHPELAIREAGARALAKAVSEEDMKQEEVLPSVVQQLLDLYDEKLCLPPPVLDSFGRVMTEAPPDHWEARSGIAFAINSLSPLLTSELASELINFFVSKALGDRHAEVRKAMLDAAVAVVDVHGKDSVSTLLPVFEHFLDAAPDSSSFDAVRQSVVILMGTLARHLEKFDPKVGPIVGKLIETLSTPSEAVQEAVANCLHPLVPAIKDDAPVWVQKLLHMLLESESYGQRRGAAYGLAGLVKGLGILSLKQLNIMNTLTTSIQDKKVYRHREGALLALEMLCTMLGRLFEPYIVHILPHLLLCFGDGNQYVREATDNTAKAVMSKLSAHGVKLVLPSLLAALEEDSWRTKAGSVELLGAMAFCAPKQLSSCLPSIVPKLIEVLSDSHTKVQKAGTQALKLIGSVIGNPEIQAIVPELLEALQDPSKKTSSCLSTLLNTRLVHFIDAPSLALIMPVVQRSFQDRSTWTRKMAARIIGNMYSLTDQKDLAPYLPTIIPGLKQSLLDPVPEVRSVSARALGALVKGMGESSFEDLLPWLMQTLTSETSPVDRSGAAQGLSEVMGSLGVEKLQKLMPEIITTAERQDIAPHVKDGYIMMFIYLPGVFTQEFTLYIGQIITPILKALADENEYVRETAMKAGQRIVNMYADTAITLLLPELEKGLFDANWRIRYSSVHLLGDLMFKISGVSGKMSTETADEDDNFGTEHSHKAILEVLGGERRNRVLAGLYMGRSDVALMVRQAALHVWKVVVTNTPRTLREILPTLFSLLLGCLASNSYDKQQVAARTLGDLVRKLGERVLPEIIPILERGLDSERADQRQGVCIGLSEIMASTSRDMVLTFVDSLVPTVKRALTDRLPEVRQAAAKTFDSLHSTVGVRALDDIIPPLLKQLSDPELAEYTLDGLKQVMAIKSKVVLPYLVPQLTSPPVNTKALAMLSGVAGDALTRHLSRILPALLQALTTAQETPQEVQELEYCQAVVLSVNDEIGVRTIIDHLLEASKNENLKWRRASVSVLCAFCTHTKANIGPYVPQLLRGLIHLFTEEDLTLLQSSWETLNSVIKTLDSTEQVQHVVDIRQAVRFAVGDLKGRDQLPGFCLPKGIAPILPVFRDAILNGPPELKEQAAQGLGEVIRLTSADALKPSVVHITGPLIRILGDRFSWNVKVAILETLALLLQKVGLMLKPFLPQLQTTFLKALGDGHRLVRLRAAAALSHLIGIHTRCDPLFTELHNAVRNTEDTAIKETMLHALRCVVTPSGDKMSEPIRTKVVQTLTSMIGTGDDSCRMIAAGCLGSLLKWLPEEELNVLAREYLLDDDLTTDWMLRHGRSVTLMIALKEAAPRILVPEWTERITKTLVSYMTADRLSVVFSGIRGTGYYLLHILQNCDSNVPNSCPQILLTTFAKNMNHNSNEVKQVVALTCNFLGKHIPGQLPNQFLRTVIPMLVNGTKEKNTVVKANSEYALVTILHLRQGETTQQACIALLDTGPRESLQDVIYKVLRKVAAQAEPKEEELDDTLLT